MLISQTLQILKNKNKVLGQNARNLLYIQKGGNAKGRNIADNKLLTKKVLTPENVPTPTLLGVIKNYDEFNSFDWDSLPRSFVMKPVHGAQGAGIEIFYNQDKNGDWIKSDGKRVPLKQIKRMCLEIIEGKYSLKNEPDNVFFEERIRTHEKLKNYTYKGSPDIRVVIFNKVPVMSYARFPTEKSKGKANMIMGAVGTGIDLASGVTTTSTYGKGKGGRGFPIEFVPGTSLPFQGLKIPYWNDILKYASKAIVATGLKFGAVDFLIDDDQGPMVVELNARPGLSIQIVNRNPLRWRLEKIKGLKIKNFEQGIRIGQDLFGGEIENRIERISGKEVISNIMPVKLKYRGKTRKTMALIDTSRRTTVIDSKTAMDLGIIDQKIQKDEFNIDSITIKLANQTINTNCKIVPESIKGYKVCIGRNSLDNFLIDIKKLEKPKENEIRKETMALSEKTSFKKLDQIFVQISKKLAILPAIRPINEKIEKEIFFQKNCNYNPQFRYKPLKFDPDTLIEELDVLNPPEDAIGTLYKNKIKEFKEMISLMESIGLNTREFTQKSIKLYGKPSKKFVKIAKKILSKSKFNKKDKNLLESSEIKTILKNALKKFELNFPIRIKETKQKINKISVGKRTGTIRLYSTCERSKESIERIIGHEIQTHLLRLQNGREQKFKIFEIGTRKYIKTEEGLANITGFIRSKQKYMKYPALLIYIMQQSLNSDFLSVYKKINKYIKNKDRCWNYTLRCKRGIADTSKPGAFTKDLYLKWTIETAKHLIDKPKFLNFAYNGKAHLDELAEFTEENKTKPDFSIKEIKKLLKNNFVR